MRETGAEVTIDRARAAPRDGEGATDVFDRVESNVCYYGRRWPTVFTRAEGSRLFDERGRSYLDFFAGAGSLNYGHNPPRLVEGMIDYLRRDGPVTSLDMMTSAKAEFLAVLSSGVLEPRGLRYRVQFTGPTGASAVEAALRLARKSTGRRRIVSLTGGYHGMSVDALAVSDAGPHPGLPALRDAEYLRVPHERDVGSLDEAIVALHSAFGAPGGPPAALLLEVVQGEGGARPLSTCYLEAAAAACREHEALLVVDDIQAGCGRTGTFFSFEPSGVRPDLVCLSKSLSGLGLPLSVVLVDPAYDVWGPGEYSGTFRGNNLAFVTARLAIEHWWAGPAFAQGVTRRGSLLASSLEACCAGRPVGVVGRGLLLGVRTPSHSFATAVADQAFERGLLVETCGRDGSVVKFIPPLTVTAEEIAHAVDVFVRCLTDVGLVTGAGRGAAERPGGDLPLAEPHAGA